MTEENTDADLENSQQDTAAVAENSSYSPSDSGNTLSVEEALEQLVDVYKPTHQIYAEFRNSEHTAIMFTVCTHRSNPTDQIKIVEEADLIEIDMDDGESKQVQFMAHGTRSGPKYEVNGGKIVYFDADDAEERVSLEEGVAKLRDSLKHPADA